jgi:two-component system sensor histidine kinase BaeS
VADTGPGIPADELPHVFDRLWRGTRARAGGGGIGLAVVKELVMAHCGTVTAESGPGGGTRMTLRPPRATPQGPQLVSGPGAKPCITSRENTPRGI